MFFRKDGNVFVKTSASFFKSKTLFQHPNYQTDKKYQAGTSPTLHEISRSRYCKKTTNNTSGTTMLQR